MNINDNTLQTVLLSQLRSFEELNDGLEPSNLRHHISSVVVGLRNDLKHYDQNINENDQNFFNPDIVVAKRYVDMLTTLGFQSHRSENGSTNMNHIMWMLYQIINDSSMSHTKRHRWLGFIQGVLVMNGLLNVETERNNTREIFNGK